MKVGDFDGPTYATGAPGDASRVFVTEKGGRVRLVLDGAVQETPFLDLTSITQSSDSERGLLSIAFAPDYAASGRFYVYLTARNPLGDIQVWEYRRSASNPNVADTTGRLLVSITHDQASNHNGGTVQVGPDGKVWLATGDGGGANNTFGHAQDPASPLGKLLRLDPGLPDPVPVEQLSQGLRNPFRFSFAPDGTIVIADVGQGAREEIDVGLAANYGWPCFEGTMAFRTDPGCTGVPLAAPVLEQDHGSDGFCAIVGGVVVRDPGLPTLNGRYVYGDNCDTALRSVDLSAPSGDAAAGLTVSRLAGIGEDACGRVLIASLTGTVSRIVDGTATPCGEVTPTPTPTVTATATPTVTATATPTATADPTTTPAADATSTASPEATATAFGGAPPSFVAPPRADLRPCTISTRVTGLRSLERRGYLSVALRTDETCRATVSVRGFRAVSAQLAPGARVVVKLRRTTSRARSITLRIEARDAAGNLRTLSQTVRAR